MEQEGDPEWEDIPETPVTQDERNGPTGESSIRLSTAGAPRATTRRRKTGKMKSFLTQSQTTPRRLTPPQPQSLKAEKKASAFEPTSDQMHDALVQSAASSALYLGSVLAHAFKLLKKPLGFLLSLYLLGCLLGWLFSSFCDAFEPVCWMPGMRSTRFCRHPLEVPQNDTLKSPRRVDFPRLVEIQSASFEQLLDGGLGGPALNLDIRRAEMATRDLITLVKHSELKSRELLGQSLYAFVLDAKKAGKGLAKLTAKINGAVDK